jgi:iron complex outermembrane recepter protein
MKVFFVCLWLVFGHCAISYSQNNYLFQGSVIDHNNEPIPGASIALNNSQHVTISDSIGHFEFILTQKGLYKLQASFIGYQTYSDTFLIQSNKNINILLQPKVVCLDEIVVRENYENTRNRKEALSIEVIKKEFIIENNAGNLIKTIGKLPGVYSMDIGSGFSKPVIRGMGFNRVAVSENGIKQEGQQWGADHGIELDQFNVEKIEIYKGPMSLQYGSDAIGGLIEIIPVSAPSINKVFGEVTLIGKSNNNLLGVSAMIGLKHNHWYAKMRMTEQHFGDYKVPTDTFVYLTRPLPIYNGKLKNTAGFERDLATTLGYSVARASSYFTVSNVFQKTGFFPGSHGVPDLNRIKEDGNSRNIELPNSNVNHFKIINNSTLKFKKWKGSLDLAFQNNHRQEWAKFHTHYGNQSLPSANPNLELDFNLNTYTGNLKFESSTDQTWKHVIGFNSDYQQNSIAGYNFLLPEFKRFTSGAYVIETYHLSENVKLTGGIRFDIGTFSIEDFYDSILEQYLKNMNLYSPEEIAFYSQRSYGINKQFNNLSWSAGMVFNPDKRQTYKANIGHSFRLPGSNELAANGIHHGTFRHEQGDTSLVSEKGYQLDVAYTFESERLYFSINPFVSWFSNYIYLNPTGEWSVLPHAGQIYKYQQAQALVSGGECTINYEFHKNFTYESSLEYVYLQNLTDGYPLPFSPPLSALNSIIWHWHSENKAFEEFHCTFEHQFVAKQERIARNEEVSESYNLFGISLNNNLKFGKTKLKLSFQIQNLLNTKFFNHLSFYRKLNIPEAGRNIQLIIRIPIN